MLDPVAAARALVAADLADPRCTEASCPDVGAHALFVEPDLGPDPFWVCHRTGLPVAAVGHFSG